MPLFRHCNTLFTVTASKCCVPISLLTKVSAEGGTLCKKAFKKIFDSVLSPPLSLYNIHAVLAFGAGQFPPLPTDAQKNIQSLQILCHLVAR